MSDKIKSPAVFRLLRRNPPVPIAQAAGWAADQKNNRRYFFL